MLPNSSRERTLKEQMITTLQLASTENILKVSLMAPIELILPWFESLFLIASQLIKEFLEIEALNQIKLTGQQSPC